MQEKHHKAWSIEEAFTVLIHTVVQSKHFQIQLYRLSQRWRFVHEHVCPLETTGGGDLTLCRLIQKLNQTQLDLYESNQLVPTAFNSKDCTPGTSAHAKVNQAMRASTVMLKKNNNNNEIENRP